MRVRKSTVILTCSIFMTWMLLFFNLQTKQVSRKIFESGETSSKTARSSNFLHHPFDNTCKFPISNIYAQDIMSVDISGTRLRTLKCNLTTSGDMASMDSHGYLYIFPKFSQYPKEVKIVKEVLQNRRLWVNADAFYVRCFNENRTMVWEKPFAGLEDSRKPKYDISIHPDFKFMKPYGNQNWMKTEAEKPDRYSIDILALDSTSRTQFMRHLPRTVEIMEQLGYHFLYGYNKVADNSMVNLAPILIGDLPEALAKPKLDESGDINLDNILPQNDSLDATNLKFIWNTMKEKYGCETLMNDDILRGNLGLFNYPQYEFKGGFRRPPADHYFRHYYLAIYKKWKYSPCLEGDQMQWEFVQIWRRFAHYYKDICHFGFSFITTLTHDQPFLLETLDERLAATLSQMYLEGLFDNSVSVIMGDHGNRIGRIQRSYSGRIEERLPLMAIRLPTGFAEKYPKQYSNFLTNKFKFTANFDIHQTLQDIVHMDFDRKYKDQQRGISLFAEIPNDRTCRQLFIPENYCTCLERVKVFVAKANLIKAVGDWIKEENLDKCIKIETLKIDSEIETMSLNKLCREGLRSKKNLTLLEITRKKSARNDFINYEFDISTQLRFDKNPIKLRFRVEHYVRERTFSVVYEPQIVHNPFSRVCQLLSLFELCSCLNF